MSDTKQTIKNGIIFGLSFVMATTFTIGLLSAGLYLFFNTEFFSKF
jgi:hypothetical protein